MKYHEISIIVQIGEKCRDCCRYTVTLCSSPMSFEIMKSFGLNPEKMTQDYFKIAPFSKKRAAFYLTQAWNRACLKSGMFKFQAVHFNIFQCCLFSKKRRSQ
jgi:hypothetical protein